jgi:aspartate/methionine/tyrosine aminotransferase
MTDGRADGLREELRRVDFGAWASRVPPSGIREIVNLVLARPEAGIVRLEVGEPDLPIEAHIVVAAQEAAAQGIGYTQSFGIAPLREAITERLHRVAGLTYAPDEIVVAQGGVQAVAAAFAAVLDAGDEVLVPDPAWPNYAMTALLRGAVPVSYPQRAADGFLPDLGQLRSAVTERTRLIVLNSPCNPTGSVYPAELVAGIVALAAEFELWVLSDEVYDELVFEGAMANAAQYDRDRVIGVYSFSKTYSMTGWRVGYAACPRPLAQLLATIQEPMLSCISGVSQQAALAALVGTQDGVADKLATYRSRRDLVSALLGDGGFDAVSPSGAFYQMVPLAPGVDSRRAALDLVEHGVATAPGTAFGRVASDQLRISLAASETALREGIDRIVGWARSTEAGAALVAST